MNKRNFLRGLLGVVGAAIGAGLAGASSAQQRRRILIQVSPLAGFQYHAGEELWPQLAVSQPLSLEREPDNPHDADAVRIDWRGHKLGYLPRAENVAVAQMLDRGERLQARIVALREASDPWQRVAIDVFLDA